jgi:hypothetical protein
VQLVGGAGEAQVPGGGLEAVQQIERRQAAGHFTFPSVMQGVPKDRLSTGRGRCRIAPLLLHAD